jgi:oxygen-independent coproporphyrinogen-3 oxidase
MPAFATDSVAQAAPAPDPGFGIYVHWPFCLSKCPYCDFNSFVRDTIDFARWQKALLAEFGHYADRAVRKRVSSIFFGGGTPSLMPPGLVGAVIDKIASLWPLAIDCEVTLEANPTSAEADNFAGYRSAGVDRLSLGVQSFDNAALKFLGRKHDAQEALKALDLARRHFPRCSFDLIYARPGQSAGDWRAELSFALDLGPEHVSLYTLTIEAGTKFQAQVARGALKPMAPEAAAQLYDLTQKLCESSGLPAYEISNHAKPGQECRHNLIYWRNGDYIGIGPGAHGRLTNGEARQALSNYRKPETWLAAVGRGGAGVETETALTHAERAAETLMMGLRLAEGVYLENFAKTVGRPFAEMVPATNLRRLIDGGFLASDGTRLWTMAKGRRVLDSVLAALLPAEP